MQDSSRTEVETAMANPLYEKMMRNQMVPQQMPQQPMMSGMQFQNPVQKNDQAGGYPGAGGRSQLGKKAEGV